VSFGIGFPESGPRATRDWIDAACRKGNRESFSSVGADGSEPGEGSKPWVFRTRLMRR